MMARKILWSLIIFYLLVILLVLPNPSSLLVRRWGRFFAPVGNQLGINNAWQFFSPAPAPPMYLTYVLDSGGQVAEGVGGSENADPLSRTFYFPEHADQGRISPNYNRLIYAMRFMVLNSQRIEMFFAPWICRRHPEAKSVTVQHVVSPIPMIETLGIGESYRDYAEKLRFDAIVVACSGSH